MKKFISVETIDGQLFECLKDYLLVTEDKIYGFSMKDICKLLEMDLNEINTFINQDEQSMQATNVPHFPVESMNHEHNYHYIISDELYNLKQDDKYWVSSRSTDAFKYLMLNLVRFKYLNFPAENAVKIAIVFEDCIRYGAELEKDK